ncbi:hypothetical protein CRD60_00880 [Bifidobacterium aemilianum]|uniref:Uncharacterized protein n=1 Tax=Bifidobacterium aemilianum TaxID=2493120 RepID=A0A366KCQ7_9BIFI|nr:hypothetical protein CRD60_00880 [Bifidobacterium aemilianum]
MTEGVLVALINAAALIWVGVMQYRQRATKTTRAKAQAMEAGMRAILKSELLAIHRVYVQAPSPPPIPVEVMDQADQIYRAYHALGGNGTGTHLYEEIMRAHLGRGEGGGDD